MLAGSSNIEKTGAGALTLATSNSGNTFTGAFLVTGGTLSLGTAQTALQNVALTLGGGADNVALTLGSPSDGAVFSTGGISVAGAGAGTVTFGYTGGTRSVISGAVTLNKSVIVNSTNGPLQFGAVSGAGGITKTGGGSMLMASAASYSGGTVLSQGGIRLQSADGLGTGGLTIGDANSGASVLTLNLAYNGSMNKAVHVTNNGTGAVSINTLNGVNGGNTATLAGTLLLDRDIAIAATSNPTANSNINVTSVISGIGAVRTTSLSNTRVTLSGSNSYSGGTTIAGGTTRTAHQAALGTGQVTLSDSAAATLDLNNTALAIHSLAGGGSLASVLTGGAAGILTLQGNNVSPAAFAGAVSGLGGLVKNGAGTQVLSGANTYTGATTVNAGTLLVDGSLANTAVSVNGGVLGGNGSIAGSVAVNAGGTLAAGSSIGSLDTGTLSLGAASTFALEINTSAGTTDLANVTGDLNLVSGALLTISDLGGDVPLTIDTTFVFIEYSGAWNGGLFTYGGNELADDAVFVFGANSYRISYDGFDNASSAVALTVVPEPGASILCGLGLGAILMMRRRGGRV